MERLTHKARYETGYNLNRGLFTWQAIDRLAAYEDLGVTPEQIKEIDRLYAEKCREVVELKRYKWIPVDERLPEDKVNPITRDAYVYPVTVDLGGATDIRYYSFCRGHWYNQGPKEMDELVMAWQERPEPYKPE